MSRKKHPERVNHERWLVSYADFITLLFAFFVVLFASSQSDKKKEVQLAHAMQQAFAHNGIFDPHSRTPPLSDHDAGAANAALAPLTLPMPEAVVAAKEVEARIEQVIREQVAKRQLNADAISVHATPDGLVVSLREAGFFASGSAVVRPESIAVLDAVADALPQGPMRVEGHTDDVPIHTAQFATNWELSTARAASITRLLIDRHAANPAQISAAGYAEFRPTASNATEAGRTENRRVDIVLLKVAVPVQTPAPTPPAQAPSR